MTQLSKRTWLSATAALAAGGIAVALTAAMPGATAVQVTRAADVRGAGYLVDDAGRGPGVDGFHYYGRWTTSAAPRAAHGGVHSSAGAHAAVAFRFTGTQASLAGLKSLGGGKATVWVDGRAAGTVDYRAATPTVTTVFTTPTLAKGTHRVVLFSAPSGGSASITVDAATVVGGNAGTVPLPAAAGDPVASASPAVSPALAGPGSDVADLNLPADAQAAAAKNPLYHGVASLSFDDGLVSQLDNAVPRLKRYSFAATFYIINLADQWGDSSYLTIAQQKQLIAAGYEIGNHSSQHYDLVAEEDGSLPTEFGSAKADLAAAQARFQRKLGVTPTTCAYPEGRTNAAVEKAAADAGLKGCRGTDGGENRNTHSKPYQAYDLYGIAVDDTTTAAQITDAVTKAKKHNGWVIFLWHNVVPTPADPYATSVTHFAAQLKAIKDSGIKVRTVGATLASLQG
jgi:peptidoglycan/xylan/chitin deacetylase (PgdA/CDA1 family)